METKIKALKELKEDFSNSIVDGEIPFFKDRNRFLKIMENLYNKGFGLKYKPRIEEHKSEIIPLERFDLSQSKSLFSSSSGK